MKPQLCFILATAIFLVWGMWLWQRPETPESKFRARFSQLSVGVPEYEKLVSFTDPLDAIKGDFCSVELWQTDVQFHQLLARLGISPEQVISTNGIWVKVENKIFPEYPWMLNIRAEANRNGNLSYKVYLKGQSPD